MKWLKCLTLVGQHFIKKIKGQNIELQNKGNKECEFCSRKKTKISDDDNMLTSGITNDMTIFLLLKRTLLAVELVLDFDFELTIHDRSRGAAGKPPLDPTIPARVAIKANPVLFRSDLERSGLTA